MSLQSDRKADNMIAITEKRVYRSGTLPKAPERLTRAEAEADEARGVELASFMKLLLTLSEKQWHAARAAGRAAVRDAAWDAVRDAARDAGRVAAWVAASALVARDLITTEHFDILVAPMRAAGIDFDNLTESETER